MSPTGYLVLVLVILLGQYLFTFLVEILNARYVRLEVPDEFKGYYDPEKYRKAQSYLKENTRFKLVLNGVFTALIVVFIFAGGFNAVDRFARGFGLGPILTGLIFAGVLMFFFEIIKVPFTAYHTFVIEEKYGFNRTTPRTFVLDLLKSWGLTAVIGGIIFAAVLWFFGALGRSAWVYSWFAVVLFEFFLTFISPVVIMPLFNKFVPLPEGELRKAVEDYAEAQGFRMKGIFKMDGSRRSNKSNAFFTGFGKYRRIVLFDTLIIRHTTDELVSVLAHEMGHYKKMHIIKFVALSAFTTGAMFFILSLLINNPSLFAAFRMEETSVYASFIFFGFLYTPINTLISIAGNVLSREYEYESDAYAAATYGKPEAMITALKKLSVDNLANLTPHPLKVFLQYNHPPVLDRISALRSMAVKSA